jgi:hypothetical protein
MSPTKRKSKKRLHKSGRERTTISLPPQIYEKAVDRANRNYGGNLSLCITAALEKAERLPAPNAA